MAIKRVDVEADDDEVIGWSWKDCNGTSESLTVSGDSLDFNSGGVMSSVIIYKEDIQHWIKALSEAQNYFNA